MTKYLMSSSASLWFALMSSPGVSGPGTFPSIETKDLNGRRLRFPRDFPDLPSLALIAFEQHHQLEVDSWVAGMRLDQEGAPPWIEFPVVGSQNIVERWMLDFWMRGGIPETDRRARVVTLYVSREAFAHALGLPSVTEAHVAVLGPSGSVRVVVTGRYRPEKEAVLRKALRSAAPD